MAEIIKNIQAHNNFYKPLLGQGEADERHINVYLYEPDNGINDETGILLLIAGFGGHSQKNVYKKMRKEFANKYNLITVQCDYFGYEFMQDEIKEETLDNFCDMSILQAMDNIYATLYAIEYGMSKSEINSKKIMAFGNSHGAYLAHLCNIYSQIFTHILDNSSWIYPKYLIHNRFISLNNKILNYKYLSSQIFGTDSKFLSLNYLYNNFFNNCYIESYHGVDDKLVPIEEKETLNNVNNFHLIKVYKADNKVFFSTTHSLGANFLELFDLFYNNIYFEKGNIFNIIDEIKFTFDNMSLNISYTNLYPYVYFSRE